MDEDELLGFFFMLISSTSIDVSGVTRTLMWVELTLTPVACLVNLLLEMLDDAGEVDGVIDTLDVTVVVDGVTTKDEVT